MKKTVKVYSYNEASWVEGLPRTVALSAEATLRAAGYDARAFRPPGSRQMALRVAAPASVVEAVIAKC